MQVSEGVILDSSTNMPIEKVQVSNCIPGDGETHCKRTFSNKYGRYRFSHITGSCPDFTLYFEKAGYHTAKRDFEARGNYDDTIYLEKTNGRE